MQKGNNRGGEEQEKPPCLLVFGLVRGEWPQYTKPIWRPDCRCTAEPAKPHIFVPFKDFQAWKNRSGCYGLTRNRDSPTYHCSWNLSSMHLVKACKYLTLKNTAVQNSLLALSFLYIIFFISDQSINTQWCLTSFLMMPDIRFLIMFWKHFLNFTDILSLKHIIS